MDDERPPQGWVTVANAAARLTAAGDAIDASNVSRYIARWEFPSKRIGKYRYVDAAALKKHRDENVLVGDKRMARDIAVDAPPIAAEPESDSSPLNEANLRLKQLQIRNQEIDLAQKEGELVPKGDVLALLSGVLVVFVDALERAEIEIAQAFGREIGAAFRKNRKAAQAKASQTLLELARKNLPPALALAVVNDKPEHKAA